MLSLSKFLFSNAIFLSWLQPSLVLFSDVGNSWISSPCTKGLMTKVGNENIAGTIF